jgi:outer membrane protein OmpA-like peptidoglycan-associated protein
VNGHAFAGGAMLALAHDFRVMRTERGYFCLPEVDLATGQPLTPGLYALLDARLDRATLHEALVTGRRYPATEAAARGLVHEALPETALLPRAVAMARELATKDRATLAALKRGLFDAALRSLTKALGLAFLAIAVVGGTAGAQPTADPPPRPKRVVLRGLAFGADTAYIEPVSRGVIEYVVERLRENPDVRVRIEGHTCSLGSEAFNHELSLRRAESVRRILEGYGIAPERLEVAGFGETRPVAPNDTRDGRAMNRRVELVLIE